MKIQYTIAKASSPEELAKKVQLKLNEGWLPQGGVSVANGASFIFVQALVLQTD